MNAEIIAVGSELLTAQRVDTNSLYLTEQLNNLGVEVTTKYVVGDNIRFFVVYGRSPPVRLGTASMGLWSGI